MKKIGLFVILLLMPISVYATSFKLRGTDMNISFDESNWYVFTPDNILNNEELEELGISYEYMVDSFNNNEAYLDAILFFLDSDDYIEVFVRKTKVDDINNFSNYSKEAIEVFGQAFIEEHNIDKYEVYQNDYYFVKLDYQDQGFYLNEYLTVVNGYGYTITVQKPYAFTSDDIEITEEVIDSIEFNIDYSLKEPRDGFSFIKVFRYVVIGALGGAIITGLGVFINKKKKKKD